MCYRVRDTLVSLVKYLRVLFTSEGRSEVNGLIGVVSALIRSLYQSIVVKRKLSQNQKALQLLVDHCFTAHLWSRVTNGRTRS